MPRGLMIVLFYTKPYLVWVSESFCLVKMLIYLDIFTGKTILTDSYKMKLIDDFYYEVEASYVTKKGDEFGDEMFGGNASVEEMADDLDGGKSVSGFDVILNHEDVEEFGEEPNFKKFLGVMKPIIAKAGKKLEADKHAEFKKKLNSFFKEGPGQKSKFSNFQIFLSKDHIDLDSGEILAAPILVDADETGMAAKIYYFKDLMVEEKM